MSLLNGLQISICHYRLSFQVPSSSSFIHMRLPSGSRFNRTAPCPLFSVEVAPSVGPAAVRPFCSLLGWGFFSSFYGFLLVLTDSRSLRGPTNYARSFSLLLPQQAFDAFAHSVQVDTPRANRSRRKSLFVSWKTSLVESTTFSLQSLLLSLALYGFRFSPTLEFSLPRGTCL